LALTNKSPYLRNGEPFLRYGDVLVKKWTKFPPLFYPKFKGVPLALNRADILQRAVEISTLG